MVKINPSIRKVFNVTVFKINSRGAIGFVFYFGKMTVIKHHVFLRFTKLYILVIYTAVH